MGLFFKKQLPLIVAFLMGVLTAIQYYVPGELSQKFLTETSNFYLIISAFAVLIGLISVIQVHYGKVKSQAPGWGYSIILYIFIILMFIIGLIDKGSVTTKQATPDGERYVMSTFGWMYNYVFVSLSGTMFALLGFFITSAAYRAFRIKTTDATLLLIAAFVVIIGMVPLGEYLWSYIRGDNWPKFSEIVEWIMNNPNTAARRAILIGVALGSIAMSLKVIFGIERGYLGMGQKE